MADTIESLKTDLLASQERAELAETALKKCAAYKFDKDLAASQLECERLREALIGYGQHDDDCAWNSDRVKDGATFCSCGLTKALSTPPSPDALAAHDREAIVTAFRKPIIGRNYGAGLWSRRNLEAALEDHLAAEREPKP